MKITVDASDALAVAADLEAAASELVGKVRPVVTSIGDEMVDALKADLAGSSSFGHAAGSVSQEPDGPTGFKVGPTKPAGAIANIAYFGGSHGGGGTVRDPLDAAESVDYVSLLNAVVDGL